MLELEGQERGGSEGEGPVATYAGPEGLKGSRMAVHCRIWSPGGGAGGAEDTNMVTQNHFISYRALQGSLTDTAGGLWDTHVSAR